MNSLSSNKSENPQSRKQKIEEIMKAVHGEVLDEVCARTLGLFDDFKCNCDTKPTTDNEYPELIDDTGDESEYQERLIKKQEVIDLFQEAGLSPPLLDEDVDGDDEFSDQELDSNGDTDDEESDGDDMHLESYNLRDKRKLKLPARFKDASSDSD